MFFPYKDDNPAILTPFVTYGIIAINIFVFFFQLSIELNSTANAQSFIYHYGLVPNDFTFISLFTSMFMHGGFAHILGNMWFLWIFGDNIESLLGHFRYALFYLTCGVGAALTQILFNPSSTIPMVGASGAIAGVLGAYMILYPKARVHVFVFFIFITTIQVPAQIVLGLWFLMQLSNGLDSLGVNLSGGVAWFAHIGGFIVGISTQKLFRTIRIE